MREKKEATKFRVVLEKLTRVMSWVLWLSGVIGLIGVLDDLAAWRKFGRYVLETAQLVGMEDVISIALLVVHTVSVYWHKWLYPVFDLLTFWLPFEIPSLLKDALIITLFVFLGRKRAFRVFARSLNGEKRIMSNIVYKYLKDTNEKFLYFNPREAREYILMRDADRSLLASYEISMVEKFERCFGEDAENFAHDVLTTPELLALREQHMSALRLSDRLKFLVYVLAAFVVVFLLFDYIYLLQQQAVCQLG